MEMHDIYRVSVFLHIFSFAFWFGGMLFLIAVFRPAIRRNETPEKYGIILESAGKTFSRITWFLLFPLFLITGLINAYSRTGSINPADWLSYHQMGKLIFIKFHLFFLILILSALHDFWLGPKATALLREKGESGKWGKISGWVGRLNFIVGLFMLIFGIGIVRGC